MLNPKIKLTEELLYHIKEKRINSGRGSIELSQAIDKPSAYISAIENKRVGSMSSALLIKIFQTLYDGISEDEAIEKIEAIISPKQGRATNGPAQSNDLSDEDDAVDQKENKTIYKLSEDYNDPELVKAMLEDVTKFFTKVYDGRPKDTVYVLNLFMRSMRFDIGFVMAILSLPYFALKSLSDEERQNAFDDIQSAFRKHFDIAQSKRDEPEIST